MWSLVFALSGCTWPSEATAPSASAGTTGQSVQAGTRARTPNIHTKTILSQPYTIDKKYMSMRGPYGFDDVVLSESPTPELLWIVGYRTTVVDADTDKVLSQEFMCHANLDVEATDYAQRFPTAPPISGRIFTLSQGQQ